MHFESTIQVLLARDLVPISSEVSEPDLTTGVMRMQDQNIPMHICMHSLAPLGGINSEHRRLTGDQVLLEIWRVHQGAECVAASTCSLSVDAPCLWQELPFLRNSCLLA